MSQTVVTRKIQAPLDLVFETISEIEHFSKAVPDIVKIEITSDVRSGVGLRFRETRLMKGQEATTELEVTEYIKNDRVRMMADTHGTVWDSVFSVSASDGQTELTLTMDTKPHRLMPKLINPFVMGFIKKALENDMDALKTYCEAKSVK